MKPVRILVVAALAAALSIAVVVSAPPANAAVSGQITECANGATVTTCDGGWTTGGLNIGNSEFHEDDVVPQRLVLSGLTPGSTGHMATITYDAKFGGVHGYDYLASYNVTVTDADACQGTTLAALCAAAPSTKDIPSDDLVHVPPAVGSDLTSDHELPQAQRQMTMFGGTVTAVSKPTHSAPTGSADTATVVVTFDAGSTGNAILIYGTHLAVGTSVSGAPHNWGTDNGASNGPGGSLATRVPTVDTSKIGGNNTIQSSAIGEFPPAAFTITKTSPTSTIAAGGNVTYTTTVTNTGGQAGSTTFTDNYNDDASVVGSLPAGCVDSTVGTDKEFTCTTTSIAAGDSQVFTYTLTMPTSFTGATTCTGGYNVTNTATLVDGPNASKTVCVTAAAAYSITKTAMPTSTGTNGEVTYTVTVTNTGSAPGTTSFSDVATNDVEPSLTGTTPDGGTCTSANVCTTSTLDPGASQDFTFSATMPDSFTGPTTCANGYKVTNTATISGLDPATADVCVSANAGFSITKTASSDTTEVNGSITYTVTVENTGTAPGSTSFTDTASNGVTPTFVAPTDPSGGTCTAANVCTTSTLDPGGTQEFSFTATMPGSFTGSPSPDCANGGYKVTNTATLANDGGSATAPVCVAAAATFSITKTASSDTAEVNGSITYTVTVENTGTAPGSTQFTDTASNGVTPTFVSPTDPSGGTCTAANVCTTSTLDPGGTQEFTFTATMPDSFTGPPGILDCLTHPGSYAVTNTAAISDDNSSTATVCVAAAADFSVEKEASSNTAGPGDTITYTVTVTNTGSATGSTSFTDDYDDDATPQDPLPAGCFDSSETDPVNAQFTCTTGSIDPGKTQVFTYDVTMPDSFSGTPEGCANGGFPVINSVTITGSAESDEDGHDSEKVCVTTAPDFSVSKMADTSTSTAGGVVGYTVVVTNNGTGPGSTSFTDDYNDAASAVLPLPDGCTDTTSGDDKQFTCDTESLDPGAQQVFHYSITMPPSFSGTPSGCTNGGFPVANLVSLEGGGGDTATVCVTTEPDFSITKTAGGNTAGAGDTVHYTVVVSNDGTGPGSTSFTDNYNDDASAVLPLPDGCTDTTSGDDKQFTCDTHSIDPGDSQTFEYDVTMPDAFSGTPSGCDNGGFPVVNSVTLEGDAGDDSAKVCVTTSPDFTVTKTADSTTANAGDPVGYTVVVTNNGTGPGSTRFTDDYNDAATPVLPLPDGCQDTSTASNKKFSCDTDSIDPGKHQTYHYAITMPASFSGGAATCDGGFAVVNTVTITGGSSTDSETVCVATEPDFSITKTAGGNTAGAGDTVHYTVVVSNDGTGPGSTSFTDNYNDDASAVLPLPDGCTDTTSGDDKQFTCDTHSIDPGDSQTFEYDVTMPDAFSGTPSGCDNGGFPVVNSVTLEGDAGDDSAKVCVTTSPDFTVTKDATTHTAEPGTPVEYTVVVKNSGSGPGTTSFTDDYNDDASPVLPLPEGCSDSSTANNQKFTCDTESIDPGEMQTFVYEITMPATFTGTPSGCDNGGYPVVNTVTVTDGGSTDGETICVTAAPDLSVSKSVEPTDPGPGDDVTYTVTVTNNGTAPGSTTVTDDYDQEHVTLGDAPEGCTDDGEVLTCETGTIEAGDDVTFEYTATITDSFGDDPDCEVDGAPGYTIVNTATIGPDNDDDVRLCVPASPDFSLTKSVDPETADAGATVHYTIVVSNDGDAAGTTGFTDNYDDRVDADLPAGSLGGICSRLTDGDDIFSCVTGTIPAHSSETFEYDAVLPDSFGSDDPQCDDGGFSVSNVATLVSGGADTPAEVCVDAAPLFHVAKSVDDTEALPNQTVHYEIVVTNDGTAPGSTTVTDNYDDQLDESITTPDGCAKGDIDGDLVLVCETDTLEPGGTQSFEYSATIPNALSGSQGDCADGTFPIVNSVTVDVSDDDDSDSVTICVPATPHFQITKSADDTSAVPGQTIHYTVTVSNDGHVATSTTFTDTITPALARTDVPDGCEVAGGVLTCTTGTIQPDDSEEFEYSVTLPATYTGDSGGGDCDPGEFPVSNTAAITSGEHGDDATELVCVTAAPALHVSKSVEKSASTDSTVLTYTIDYSNTGPAEARHTVLTDPIPDGTTFVSCSAGCTHAGTPDTATWDIGNLAPLTGSGTVTLVVKVTGKQACSVSNTAQIDADTVDPVSSNTVVTEVTPPTDPTGANAHGSGAGAQVLTAGLVNLLIGHNGDPIGYSESSQTGPGGPVTDSDSVLSAKVPSNGNLVKGGLVNTSSASAVNGSPIAARQLSTAEVANVCLLPVGGVCTVEASAVRAVAATLANGTTVGTSSAGSSIANLKIAGLGTPVDLNSTTKITLNPLVFGPGSYVAINEHQSTTGLKDGKLYADMTTTMIHLKVTGLLRLQSVEIVVAQAKAHSEFLKTFECNPNANSVSGHAYVAGVNTGPLQTNVVQGFVGMGPKGGGSEQHLVAVVLPANGGLVTAAVADSRTQGTVTGTSADSFSVAEVAGAEGAPACVVRTSPTQCLVEAVAVRSEARSHADQTDGSVSTSAGTTFAGLKVLGLPVDVNVPPNTTINLPGIGYVVLNEQTCDGGGLAVNGSCAGYPHSGITVRAVHVVVTVLGNVLGLQPAVQVVVAEAHADSTVF